MSNITIFNHLGNDIRVMTDKQGEPLFVASDVAGILILTERIDTGGKLRPQLLVTPQGQTYFANILSK